MLRVLLWDKLSLADLIKAYGAACALKRARATSEQVYLPGFYDKSMRQHLLVIKYEHIKIQNLAFTKIE